MDKVVASPADAVADIPDGASIAISGFGLSSGVPNSLLAAAAEQGAKDLCLVANGVGGAAAKLIENNQVSKLIVSFTARPNIESAAAEKAAAGHLTYEMVPQGTLVERLRARPGLRPEDVFINFVEVVKENWSFGNGIAQYVV